MRPRWWQVQWPPFFSLALRDHYKSVWLGWLLITWRRDDGRAYPWPADLDVGWYPRGG